MPSAEKNEVAKRLREARELLGLTQHEVAQRLNKTQSYVSRCETGSRRLDIFELQAFADLYDQSLSSFLPPKCE